MMPSSLETGFEPPLGTVLMWPTEALELCVVGDAGAAAGGLDAAAGRTEFVERKLKLKFELWLLA